MTGAQTDEKFIQTFGWKTWREGKGRDETTLENNIKMYIKYIGCEGVVWVRVAQVRVL
jgi:hypothetical protein